MQELALSYGKDYEGHLLRDEAPRQFAAQMRERHELVFVLAGTADFWVGEQFYHLVPGDVLVLPCDVMVGGALRARGCPYERVHVWLSHRFTDGLCRQDTQALYLFGQAQSRRAYLLRCPTHHHDELRELFGRVQRECQCADINAELSCKAFIASLLVGLNRLLQSDETLLLPGEENRLAQVIDHIHQNCTEALTVEKLAEQFRYSPSHLAHSFKKQLGTSLYHYVLLLRLQIGRRAMLEGVPVKEAYQRCGFGDYAGFYRTFTKEYGLSPQQYKKMHQ